MKTNKANKGIRGFGLGRVLAGLVLAGAVLSLATGAEAAIKFKKSCQNMLSSSEMQDVEDAAWLLEDHFDEIVDYTNLDPWDSGFRYFDATMRHELRKEVQELRGGKIPLKCYSPNEKVGFVTKCQEDPDWSIAGSTRGPLAHDVGFDGVSLCPDNSKFPDDVAGIAGLLIHELTHHIDSEKHRGYCAETYMVDVYGVAIPYQEPMRDHAGRVYRCKKDNKKNIKEQCPASSLPVSCEKIGSTVDPEVSANLDGAAPHAAETVGYAAEDYLGRPELSATVTATDSWFYEDDDELTYLAVRVWFQVENRSARPEAISPHVTDPTRAFCKNDLDSCTFLGGKKTTLAAGEVWTSAMTFSIRDFRVVSDDLGMVWMTFETGARLYQRYPDTKDKATFAVATVDEVEFPIVPLNAIVDTAVTGKSGVECGNAPGSPGLQSNDVAFLEADSKVDARLAHRCFGGDKPSELILGGMFGNGPLSSATSWDDYCAETCEAQYPSAVGVSGSAKVIDKAVSLLWEQEVPNACGSGGGAPFVAPHGGSASYSAYQTRLEGTGTCGCSCELG